ncbi:MAG: hypothetical protein IAE79_26580, partial [Anaerolinea sp.]|nr:hypothetical protein [Anaerolinea sp.]
TATFTPTPEPTTTPIPEPLQPPEPGVRIAISELQMLASLLTGLTAVLVLSLVIGQKLQADRSQQVGWSLWGLAGALLLYNYFGLGLPGTAVFANLGSWGGLFTTLFGGVIGIALYWVSNWGLYVKRET